MRILISTSKYTQSFPQALSSLGDGPDRGLAASASRGRRARSVRLRGSGAPGSAAPDPGVEAPPAPRIPRGLILPAESPRTICRPEAPTAHVLWSQADVEASEAYPKLRASDV